MTTYREIGICNTPYRLHIAVTYTDGNQQTFCHSFYYFRDVFIKQLDFWYICNNLFGIEHRCNNCNFMCEELYFPDNVLAVFEDGIYTIYNDPDLDDALLFESRSLDETLDYLRSRYSYLLTPIKVAIKNK